MDKASSSSPCAKMSVCWPPGTSRTRRLGRKSLPEADASESPAVAFSVSGVNFPNVAKPRGMLSVIAVGSKQKLSATRELANVVEVGIHSCAGIPVFFFGFLGIQISFIQV